MFATHYRKQLNLTDEALEASVQAVRRIGEFADRLAKAVAGGTAELAAAADEAERRVRAALFDDLNAPEALAALFDFIRRANAELDRRGGDRDGRRSARAQAFARIDGVLDLVPARRTPRRRRCATERERLAAWVEERLAARREARARAGFRAGGRDPRQSSKGAGRRRSKDGPARRRGGELVR